MGCGGGCARLCVSSRWNKWELKIGVAGGGKLPRAGGRLSFPVHVFRAREPAEQDGDE